MVVEPVRLETERLLLRLPSAEDFEPYAAYMADAESTRYLGGPQARSVAWRGFATMCGSWYLNGFSMFSVVERSTERWVGRVGPWMPDSWPGTEVGWGIVRDACGRGYATEAASAAIDWAFSTLGWQEVVHVIDIDNAASQRVATKLGSRNRGPCRLPTPYEDVDAELWGQSRRHWETRAPRSS